MFWLRRQLAVEEARRRGFEDGLGDSETEPREMSAEEKVAYDAARVRGVSTARKLEQHPDDRPRSYVRRS